MPRPLVKNSLAIACVFVLGLADARHDVRAQESKRTIWDGVFNEAQATRGQNGYKQSCAPCHKADLLGDTGAPALAGPEFFSRWNGSSADDLVKTIRASMPQDAPDTLGTQAYVDLVAFLIKSNGAPAGASELSMDSAALKQVMVSNPK
ncbi:MAG TPA: cytochrome c [Vicinamibacterales bacterium]